MARLAHITLLFALLLIAPLAGCSAGATHRNPSFPLNVDEAKADLRRMASDQVAAERPIVVLAGWADPAAAPAFWKWRIREALERDVEVIRLSFVFDPTFAACREKVLDTVERRLGSHDVEVDVIAFSMGGLIARHAAMETAEDERRLRMVRLFTISTPHKGTDRAWLNPLDARVRDMKPGSAFLAELDGGLGEAEYEMHCYTQLRDWIVPSAFAAPEGVTPWWVPRGVMPLGHGRDFGDARIVADILRRLRGEAPWTTHPPAPLPLDDLDSADAGELR